MTAARTPSTEDLERAWREIHLPDWPSLHELATAATRYALVRARATAQANGLQPDAPPVATPVPPLALQTPAHPRKRRRDDGVPGYSTQMAASGEYARHDTD